MDRANAARIQEWDVRPVSGGYRGLQELAADSFSGAVTTGTAWLFMLNGRVVGVADGTLSSFESGDATAHEAPDPTLPLLFAMQERGGEPRAKYYTDDNPLPEVHETLSEGGFTGYVELSDNVLSGDYYVVYYGGKSMSAAFVGNAEKLVTGDDAFRQAAEEVGIYEVIDVELDVRDVPEPTGAEPESTPPADGPAAEPEPEPAAEVEDAPAEPDAESASDPTSEADAEPAEDAPDTPEPTPDESGPAEPTAGGDRAEAASDREDPFSQEAAWREARTIPALDPDETDPPTAAEDGGQQPAPPEPTEPEPTPDAGVDDDRIAELEAAIEEQSETIEALESKLEASSTETEELREERATLRAELQAAREGDPTAAGSAPSVGEPLDHHTALDQTDLFVRYGSKGKPTLQSAHDGEADRETVRSNLRIDHHTRFEEADVTVEGQPFDAFLDGCLEYRFVDWLVTEFLFEIQDTGSQRGLRDLFDAIPLIDRVEFQGEVSWRDQDAGETHTETFDVVCRDRMGGALIVANLNDVRDPATGEMMDALVDGASAIAAGVETLGGAFLVTSSFFQPEALETADDATGGGLLSRDKRRSYVKLGRKTGYHLCLVEARGDDFHVAVPEL